MQHVARMWMMIGYGRHPNAGVGWTIQRVPSVSPTPLLASPGAAPPGIFPFIFREMVVPPR